MILDFIENCNNYLFLSTIIFVALAVTWDKKGERVNLVIKIFFTLMSIYGLFMSLVEGGYLLKFN